MEADPEEQENGDDGPRHEVDDEADQLPHR
jgi:hypothetical protein